MMAGSRDLHRSLHLSLLCSFLPPAIFNHSYSFTHIDQVSAECSEMEWCGVLYGMLTHLRGRASLIASSIPSVTFYHASIAYWISVNEMLSCPTLLRLTLKPDQQNDQIIIPCELSSRTTTSAVYGPQLSFLMSPCTPLHRFKIPIKTQPLKIQS